MTLAPLFSAGPVIFIHAVVAIVAFFLGLIQLLGKKGTVPHRVIGWVWVVMLFVVAVSSFWINEIRTLGPFSAIHLLTIFTLVTLPLGVWYARRGNVKQHKAVMISMFFGALVVAGVLTLLPGRVMYQVFFGL